MSGLPTTGLSLALISALALSGGFALQHHAARRAPRLRLRRPLESARSLMGARRFVAGFALGLLGWALYVAALAFAPLSLVQAVSASGIGVLVLGVALVTRRLPSRRETAGALLATAGLAALALSLVHAHAAARVSPSGLRVAICTILVAIAVALLVRRPSIGAAGTGAGLCYGLGDVATKALMDALHAHSSGAGVYLGCALAAHGTGFVLLQRAFQRGGVVAAVAPMTAAMNLLPMAAGVLVLGDALPSSPLLLSLRVAAFAAAAGGACMLALVREDPPGSLSAPELPPASRPSPIAVVHA